MDLSHVNSPSQSPPNFHIGPYRIGGPYAEYILFLLILVYAMNLLDRQILAILAGEIQADLGISDSQMGFLYGTSFAVFTLSLACRLDAWQICGSAKHSSPAAFLPGAS